MFLKEDQCLFKNACLIEVSSKFIREKIVILIFFGISALINDQLNAFLQTLALIIFRIKGYAA